MSKIHAMRLINLNYNNNAIKISDETFHLNGESTLLSLRNGGGKSVLVQMMTAPFVHKRYRDAKDRPFESYFTTNKPSFILVEWELDQSAGYVLTGMMVRRSQEMAEENIEALEMYNFISEYKERNLYDIYHLPIVEKTKKEMTLKNFTACRQLFETCKRDKSQKFNYYNMANPAQSRQYFEKLKEFQIHYKEWETIIKKVNLKESGLSDLFADCKDEKGLVEKWFLDAVESKLNKDKNRMQEFQSIVEKYVRQYRENQSKIQRRDTIRLFREDAVAIEEGANAFRQVELSEVRQETRIANFIQAVEGCRDLTEEKVQEKKGKIAGIQTEIEQIEYEKLSNEIYELLKREHFHTSNREMIAMEQEELEREAEKIAMQLALFACAKEAEEVEEARAEGKRAAQNLEVSRKKDSDLEPERKKLGYTLKHFYRQELDKNEEAQKELRLRGQNLQEKMQENKACQSRLLEEILENQKTFGALQAKIQSFDDEEESFNRTFSEKLQRNILNEYEPAQLEICGREYEKALQETERSRGRVRQNLEELKRNHHERERAIEDGRQELAGLVQEQKEKETFLVELEEELKERRIILQYLNLGESMCFQTEKIEQTAERKLEEISRTRRKMELDESQLQKEYQKLTQGKLLELPEEFQSLMEHIGLHAVYGMEWLGKNGNSAEKNQELVKRHPFLPYAILLTKRELEKLTEAAEEVFTSFPIPIMQRESLEQIEEEQQKAVVHLPEISFYVWFNHKLLDADALQLLVKEKEKQIQKAKAAIEIKKTEFNEYFEKKEKIRHQKVTKEIYENTLERRSELVEERKQREGQLRKEMQELEALKQERAQQEQLLQDLAGQLQFQQQRVEHFQKFCKAYEIYLQNRKLFEKNQKETARKQKQQKLLEETLEKYQEQRQSQETSLQEFIWKAKELSGKRVQYSRYEECQLLEGDPQEFEARYQAITAGVSNEQRLLEEQLEQAQRRLERFTKSYQEKLQKYSLCEKDLESVIYNKKEESHQEVRQEDVRRKIEGKKSLWNEEDKVAAVIGQQIKERRQAMLKVCGTEEPMPKAQIHIVNFEEQLAKLRHQIQEEEKEIYTLQKKLQSFEASLTALAEFHEFIPEKDTVWEQDFANMTEKQLREYQGILLRDYRSLNEERKEKRDKLYRLLNQLIQKEIYTEDFYRKPLEAMIEISTRASQVLSQLHTTIQSYDNLMQVLEVDISRIEAEKEEIVGLLSDYIYDVHQNLGKIDHNSTITIRERAIKMLKIELPDWEAEESIYQLRLQDFMDELTKKGLSIYEKNENPTEYYGTRLTTKNLYDTVVGIGNVQIKLYKIEEQREYPITWAQVARNSGGEGFLSAFVILSSLLYYMRRDDSDIFADRNEGKVLVMDNPFAQTNASHLLKPLMDMAKKTNTQLICLSGLGGESIYNRFDNIYVLNLIAASLRNGMQYLRADHTRGAEEETMVVSQIEVMEQQELVF